MGDKPETGSIGWFDLTVEHGEQIRDFYAQVTGWKTEDHSMGDYSDYMMKTANTETPVAGICHARGENVNLPPQWLMYVRIADLEASLTSCVDLGGKVVCPPRSMGSYGTMAVIQDPAGAVIALMQPPAAK
jgi:predicted enzyme related to lactoylglutathione lyase